MSKLIEKIVKFAVTVTRDGHDIITFTLVSSDVTTPNLNIFYADFTVFLDLALAVSTIIF